MPAEVSRIRGLAASPLGASVALRGDLVTARARSFAPIRSARAPPVTTSSRRRSEDRSRASPRRPRPSGDSIEIATRASHGSREDGEVVRDRVSSSGPHRTRRSRGALAVPVPPRRGAAAIRDATRTRSRGPGPGSARSEPTSLPRRGPQGPRAASPATPRRALGLAAPEVLSIDGPPWAELGTFVLCRTSRGGLSTVSHQPVETT